MEVLGSRRVHGDGDGLQPHLQNPPHCCLDLAAQGLQVLVDAMKHATLPLICCCLHILPEIVHLQHTSASGQGFKHTCMCDNLVAACLQVLSDAVEHVVLPLVYCYLHTLPCTYSGRTQHVAGCRSMWHCCST